MKNKKIYLYSILTEDDIEQASDIISIEPKLNTDLAFKSKKSAAKYVLEHTDWFWAYIYSFDGNELNYELTIDDDGNVYNEDERKQIMMQELGSEEAYNQFMSAMQEDLNKLIAKGE